MRLWAGYLSATVTATPWLSVTPEVRLDLYEVNGARAQDVGPRLASTLGLGETMELRLTAGRFTQLPALPLQVPGAEAFGLRHLGLQRSWQGSAGVETGRLAFMKLGATAYVQRGRLSELRNPTENDPDPLAADFMTSREALAYGLELMARRPGAGANRLHGWLSYTLSNSLRSYGGGGIGPSHWDQRHVLNLVLGYRLGQTTVGGRAHFHSGRPIYLNDPLGHEYIRLPPYFQLDLRVDHTIVFDRFTLAVYAELVNATFSRQDYGFAQALDPNELERHGTRIVLPSVGLRAEL